MIDLTHKLLLRGSNPRNISRKLKIEEEIVSQYLIERHQLDTKYNKKILDKVLITEKNSAYERAISEIKRGELLNG